MLKRNELKTWFPDDELLVVPESALPDELSDAATRTLLTEVGVPESFLDVMELNIAIVEGISRVDEIYRRYDEKAPDGTENLFYLGYAGQSLLAIDGRSGQVLQVHREFGARPLAGSLEAFLRVLGFVSGEVRKHQRRRKDSAERFAERLIDSAERFAERLIADALEQLKREDPEALPAAEPAWRAFLADVAAASS